jgi:hypothetical protein
LNYINHTKYKKRINFQQCFQIKYNKLPKTLRKYKQNKINNQHNSIIYKTIKNNQHETEKNSCNWKRNGWIQVL